MVLPAALACLASSFDSPVFALLISLDVLRILLRNVSRSEPGPLTVPGLKACTRIHFDLRFCSSENAVCAATDKSTRWPSSDSDAVLEADSRSVIVFNCSRNLSAMKVMAGK